MSRMRIGFIGGAGHHYLARAFPNNQGAHEFAIADDGHDPDATRAFAAKLPPTTPAFSTAADLLNTFRPDVVSIGAVYAHQADFAAMCLERDVPAVCDKPVANTWADYDRLVALCAANPARRRLITEFDFRARPEFRAARNAVRSGQLGEVALITAQKSYRWGTRPAWYKSRADYPSTLLWIGCHGIDAMKFVGGVTFATVTATQGNATRPEWGTAEDHAVATYEFTGGGAGVLHADYLRPQAAATHGDDRLRVAGSNGVLEVRDNRCWLTTTTDPQKDITPTGGPAVPPGAVMLDAAVNGNEEFFSTAASLELAHVLLRSRDAADLGVKLWI